MVNLPVPGLQLSNPIVEVEGVAPLKSPQAVPMLCSRATLREGVILEGMTACSRGSSAAATWLCRAVW